MMGERNLGCFEQESSGNHGPRNESWMERNINTESGCGWQRRGGINN